MPRTWNASTVDTSTALRRVYDVAALTPLLPPDSSFSEPCTQCRPPGVLRWFWTKESEARSSLRFASVASCAGRSTVGWTHKQASDESGLGFVQRDDAHRLGLNDLE